MSFQGLDKDGNPVTIQNPPLGPALKASSLPFGLATDDPIYAALAALGTQTTVAAILAKLSADPATQTTLAAILTALAGNLKNVPTVAVFNNGATGTGSLLAGSATFTGTARDVGVAAGTAHGFAYFNAFFLTDQAGTAYIEGSNDNSTWYTVATASLIAGTPLTLSTPVSTRYHRSKVVNGSVAQTYLWVNSSYTAS